MNLHGRTLDPFAKEILTVSSVSKKLSASVYNPSGAPRAEGCVITTETDDLRYWSDGSVPTVAEGNLVANPNTITLEGFVEIAQFKAIRVTGDVTISVTYYR